ncbi:centromere protein H [Trichosurus vulpecula]|uniref:centromere protein H n=1 Tax=Trichosurus vulpecula TaxID=9337 RepID=UPI00186B4C1F|nr:centromere protein H [Trichosurus vulpecula]
MEALGARSRRTTRRSLHRIGEAREEDGEVRVALRRRTWSSPGRKAPKDEEEVSRATPSSCPRPRRALEKKEEKEKEAAGQRATPTSGQYPRDKEKEAPSTQSRRARSSGRRSAPGEDEEVRRSRPGRPEHSASSNEQQGPEDVLAKRSAQGRNAPEEDEAEGPRPCSPGAKQSLRKYTGDEEEQAWSSSSLRPKLGPSGDAKLRDAAPASARSSTGKNAPGEKGAGTRPRRARSGAGGDAKVREQEKPVLGSRARRRASAPVKYAVGGEDEETPRTRDVTRRVRDGTSGNLGEEAWGEEGLVRKTRRPAPGPSGDAGGYGQDPSARRATTSSTTRDESPPASSDRKERGAEETGEEDEDCKMVQQLLRLKDQLKQQLLEYKAEVEASEESPTEELTEGDLLQRIEDVEKKMEEVKIELEVKTLALKRVQVAHALQKKLEKKDSESESILAILKSILTHNNSILKAQQQSRDLEEKMLEVKKKRLMFKKAGEEKLLEIQAENKKKKDELNLLKNSALLTKMKKSLQKEIDATTIIQNVFQHIVMATKIDWAADPALEALILQLEKNLSFV